MEDKTKKVLKWVPSAVIAVAIAAGAVSKFANLPQLVEIYSKIGLLPYMKVLGISELVFAALFLWPRSMKVGFYLLTGYFGGAMAVEISHGTIFIAPATILAFVWIAAYMRDAYMFLPVQQSNFL